KAFALITGVAKRVHCAPLTATLGVAFQIVSALSTERRSRHERGLQGNHVNRCFLDKPMIGDQQRGTRAAQRRLVRWLPQTTCALCRKLGRFSAAVATSREGQRSKGVFVMTLHAGWVVTNSGPSRRHPAEGCWMIRCN